MFLTFSTQWNSIGRRNRRWKAALEPGAWIALHFHSSRFQNLTTRLTQTNKTKEGFSFSFHKNYKVGPTYPRLPIFFLGELNQTSPLVCFEGWNKLSVPICSPWELISLAAVFWALRGIQKTAARETIVYSIFYSFWLSVPPLTPHIRHTVTIFGGRCRQYQKLIHKNVEVF